MTWGKSIILAFSLFGAFIATLVTVCVRQDISLVTKDYYKEELVFQHQIDRVKETALLSEKPFIQVEGKKLLKITYGDFSAVDQGALELFRPSDPGMDKAFALKKTSERTQFFSTQGMVKGMYRARLRWNMRGKEYFVEQVIQL